MAAGRHGGYRDNEFRDRESDLNVTRRRNFYYSKEAYYGYHNGRDRETERSKERDGKDRLRVRDKDIKEKEVINGGYYSSLNSEHRHGGVSDSVVDREPGELSSGNGSDDAIVSESRVMYKVALKSENEVRQSPGKKRKFSPIVWDREEKETGNFLKNWVAPTSSPLHPPLTLSRTPSIKPKQFHGLQLSPAKPIVVPCSVGSAVAELSVGLSSSLFEEKHGSSDQRHGFLSEEEFAPTRNISASRWAVKDEDEVSGDGVHTRMDKVAAFTIEDSGGSHAKSSESDEGNHLVRSSSKGEFPENELDKNGYMEIDKEDDSEGENGSCRPQRNLNMLQGCRSVHEFERLNKIDEGTYGVVFRARDKSTGEVVALKKVKMEKEREGFPLTSLREINILLSSHHPSIVDVKEVVMGKNCDDVYMVMEYMEHDLKGLMETMKQPFSQSEVKCLLLQLLEGVEYLHDNWVLHRDLKTSNILLNNRGELKICDFGLSRQYGSPLKPYTQLVVTLWYRAPELLLGVKQYSTAIDMWSLGCIMAELLAKEPLFSGKSEVDQLDKIFRVLGTPNETIWPGFSTLAGAKVNFVKHKYNLLRKKFPPTSFTGSPILSDAGFDLLNRLLTYDPEKRITAQDAVNHKWFHEVPLPKSKDFMPTFPAQHAQDRRQRRTIMKSPDPLEEQRIRELQQGELGTGGLFG